MQENYELVQRGFRKLVVTFSGYIGREFSKKYKNAWWDEVLEALSDQHDLPSDGEYGYLIDSLDILNCIRLLERRWKEVFQDELPLNCRTWAKELKGIRNKVAHIGQQDLDQPIAERALDTMRLLCKELDSDDAAEIEKIYEEVRKRANDYRPVTRIFEGVEQPASESNRGELMKDSLLQLVGTDVVQKTTLTRKVTYGGKTVIYPVYRIRLDYLFYNDQNDRIATWITRYQAENGEDSLLELGREEYNNVIETFIYESNPDAISKTQKNILLVGQREPGVTLSDGRIVDGNRRYTCLRRIQREKIGPVYFETVIMDMDIREDKKQIKLLELAIQHGEEKKVDYDLIDYAIGTYRDIVQTKLLTLDEYATGTNEKPADVKNRIEIAEIISEFLKYIKLPEQYHIAREYQVYSLFQEMMAPLKKLNESEKAQLKKITFNNAMMKVIPDQRKFIRDIKGLVKNGTYESYFEEQMNWINVIRDKFDMCEVHSKSDIDKFAEENAKIAEELQISMERALQKSRSIILKNKPVENVSKSITLLTEVDSRLFGRLEEEEKKQLKDELDELARIVDVFREKLVR
ncbi:Swt1 family HEPN domain-containing protein [Eubacterium sp. MSJ-33]|uniref:Swt1 family HEPN domain-containing protein n=1 Tax=Eubacterium sp. MSJ-33 TaxID=2841528 RepID=UPI001C7878AC|nr:Swt1 family HEPN domain-containing protein [Eubacterium sp. MSJ-33]QWT53069.1 hypothetical protein KP625_00110 [Eubacterium sp. MSJ-33]